MSVVDKLNGFLDKAIEKVFGPDKYDEPIQKLAELIEKVQNISTYPYHELSVRTHHTLPRPEFETPYDDEIKKTAAELDQIDRKLDETTLTLAQFKRELFMTPRFISEIAPPKLKPTAETSYVDVFKDWRQNTGAGFFLNMPVIIDTLKKEISDCMMLLTEEERKPEVQENPESLNLISKFTENLFEINSALDELSALFPGNKKSQEQQPEP